MSFLLRAAVLALLLTPLGVWAAPGYQRALLAMTGLLLGADLAAATGGSADLAATNALVVYLALCLASQPASWQQRVRACLLGVASLVAIECLVGALSISAAPGAGARTVAFLQWLAGFARWAGVPLVWWALLGAGLAGLLPLSTRPTVRPAR